MRRRRRRLSVWAGWSSTSPQSPSSRTRKLTPTDFHPEGFSKANEPNPEYTDSHRPTLSPVGSRSATRDRSGAVVSESGLLVVEALVQILVDADDDMDDESDDDITTTTTAKAAADVSAALQQLASVLPAHEDYRVYFSACLGHLAVLLHLNDAHAAAVAAVLKAFGGTEPGPVCWPLALVEVSRSPLARMVSRLATALHTSATQRDVLPGRLYVCTRKPRHVFWGESGKQEH